MNTQNGVVTALAVNKCVENNTEYVFLKVSNREKLVKMKREDLKMHILVDKDIRVLNMKIRRDNALVFDNSAEERIFYNNLCLRINKMDRNGIDLEIPFYVLNELQDFVNRDDVAVWYEFEKERYGKNLINILKYFCTFLDDIEIETIMFGKVKRIIDFVCIDNEYKDDVYKKTVESDILPKLKQKYHRDVNIVKFKDNLKNPLAFRYIVRFLEDVWKDTSNPDRKELVLFSIYAIRESFKLLRYTEPGYYMYKIFLLDLKKKLTDYLNSNLKELTLTPLTELEKKRLFREAISLAKEKVDAFKEYAKRINREYSLYLTRKGKEMYDLISKFVTSNNLLNTSLDLTYENALQFRIKEVETFVDKINKEIYAVIGNDDKKLEFLNDSVFLVKLLDEVQGVVAAPKTEISKLMLKLLSTTLDMKYALIIKNLNNIKGSKLEIFRLFFALVKEVKKKHKSRYLNDVNVYLMPAYAEFKGIHNIDKYRQNEYGYDMLQPEKAYFCKIAWLIAYDFCYKFFYLNGVGGLDDTILAECMLNVFQDIVIHGTILKKENFKNFVKDFNNACIVENIPVLNWGNRPISCKDIFDSFVVENIIQYIRFEDDLI